MIKDKDREDSEMTHLLTFLALIQVLEEKGVVTKEEVLERALKIVETAKNSDDETEFHQRFMDNDNE